MTGFREQILEPKYTKAEARNTSFPHRESDSSTLDIELILILIQSFLMTGGQWVECQPEQCCYQPVLACMVWSVEIRWGIEKIACH